MAQKRTIARPYAAALFEVAIREQAVGAWIERLDFLARASKYDAVERMLADPVLDADVKAHHLFELIEASFGARSDLTALRNFVRLLAMNKRLDIFAEVHDEFERLKKEAEKRHQVFVTSAYDLDDTQRNTISERLAARLGVEVEIHEETDDTLIGGAIVRYGDQVIDGSLRGRLRKLREHLEKRAA